MTQDFWLTSGWHLLQRDVDGHLVPTSDFMMAYFARDEVAPQEDSCDAELALHARLSAEHVRIVREMQRALSLSDEERMLLRMRFVGELNAPAIGAEIGMEAQTVRRRLLRVLERVGEAIERFGLELGPSWPG